MKLDFSAFTDMFQKKDKDIFILVKESDTGIITYVNPVVKQFNKAYKVQLISFLQGVIKMLEDKDA